MGASGQLNIQTSLPPRKEPPVLTGYEVRWGPRPDCTFWRKEKSLSPAWNLVPTHCDYISITGCKHTGINSQMCIHATCLPSSCSLLCSAGSSCSSRFKRLSSTKPSNICTHLDSATGVSTIKN